MNLFEVRHTLENYILSRIFPYASDRT